jgi:hypothetical protein
MSRFIYKEKEFRRNSYSRKSEFMIKNFGVLLLIILPFLLSSQSPDLCDPQILEPVMEINNVNFCAPNEVNAERQLRVVEPVASQLVVVWRLQEAPVGSSFSIGDEFTEGEVNDEFRVTGGTGGSRLTMRIRGNGESSMNGSALYGTWVFDVYFVDTIQNCRSEIFPGANITSNDLPVVSAVGPYGPYCETAGIQTLSGSPAGPEGEWGPNELASLSDNGDGTADFDPSGLASESPIDLIYTYTNSAGCSASDEVRIEILASPTVSINNVTGFPNSELCEAEQGAFLASPTAAGPPAVESYIWSFLGSPDLSGVGQSANDGTNRQQRPTWNSSGMYTVDLSVEFENGCISIAPQREVTVNENPSVAIMPSGLTELLCLREEVQFTAEVTGGEEPYTYEWADPTNLDDPNIQNPTYSSDEAGLVTLLLVVTDDNGCTGDALVGFEVGDTLAPEIICPDDFTVSTEPGTCEGLANYGILYSDNCSGNSVYGFVGAFDPANWLFENEPGATGSVDVSAAPASLVLFGSDGVPAMELESRLCIEIPGAGMGNLSFSWEYETLDVDGPFWDPFGYSVDGAFTQLTNNAGGSIQNGNESIMLNPGQNFCFVARTVDNDFGPAITIAMNFEYMEGMGLSLNQLEGVASGELIPLGDSFFEFEAEDELGNSASCSFTITVEDNEFPVMFCPDDIVIDLPPYTCGAVVSFSLDVSDNCPGVSPIVKLDGTGLDNEDFFPIGMYTLVYGASDMAGNFSSCSFEVIVNDFFNTDVGCNHLNYSFDENCGGAITADMVLVGEPLGCLEAFIINVIDKNGQLAGDTPNFDMLGQTLMYQVEHPVLGFLCMGSIRIEDKFRPTIECVRDTINCLEGIDNAKLPEITDNCPIVSLVLLDMITERLDCDPDFLGRVTRVYKAVDKYGNESDPCTQIVDMARTDWSDLVWPAHFAGEEALVCNTFPVDEKGNPSKYFTGIPTLNGVPLLPETMEVICNGYVLYTDHVIVDSPCKKIIQRTWEVGEWWCSSTNHRTHVQMIEIFDKIPPVISGLNDITASVQAHKCEALIMLPAAILTDNCNSVSVDYISTGFGVLYTNGGLVALPSGEHTIEYAASDLCGNQTTATITVTILDRIEPTPICVKSTISLGMDGQGYITPSSIDDGSFDDCGPVSLLIRRMEDHCGISGTDWTDILYFCCEDAHQEHMVEMLVTDASGNNNTCMVTLEVQDKIPGAMSCPQNMNVGCDFLFDPNNLGNYFGEPELFDNCPSNLFVEEDFSEDRDQCGIGNATRVLRLFENGTLLQTCTQHIIFFTENTFNIDSIIWPQNYTTTTECMMIDLSPDNLPEGFGRPVVNNSSCSMAGASLIHEDFYEFASGSNCFKIIRTWAVVDWCGRTSSGEFTRYEMNPPQEIVVYNTIDPEITSSEDFRFECTFDSECADGFIELTASATDDCTPLDELVWSWRIDPFKSGSGFILGTGNDASGHYPVGIHNIEFTVLDKCGNFAYTSYDFEIRSCKAATPVCIQGLATELQLWDTNGDGEPDSEMVSIPADFFNNKSFHSCYDESDLLISFSEDVNDTLRSFDCDDIGMVPIFMWVTSPNGAQTFCETFLDVQPNENSICPEMRRFDIAGRIETEDQRMVADVQVLLSGSESIIRTTQQDGAYDFGAMPENRAYDIIPSKNNDVLNGITTLDLLLIQRHILGLSQLDSPFKLIAADVNDSGNISTADLVELRRLILGTIQEFTNNESWRFVDKTQVIEDPTNPLGSMMMDMYEIEKLQEDMTVDFVAIKIGDVNGNAVANIKDQNLDTRNLNTLVLGFENINFSKGEFVSLPVYAQEETRLFGIQFALDAAFAGDITVKSGLLEVDSDNQVLKNGTFRLSATAYNGISINTSDALFYIEFEAMNAGAINHVLTLSSGLKAEAYLTREFDIHHIEFRELDDELAVFNLMQNEPNPWLDATRIPVHLPQKGSVDFKIFDQSGRMIFKTQYQMSGGINYIELNRAALNMNSGMYLYEIEYNGQRMTRKMLTIE